MTRPKRLYLNSKGKYYYIIDGKKKYIKVPATMSQKQVQNINIKNIIGTTARRLKRRKKKVEPRYQQRIVPNMVENSQSGLPSYIFRPSKSFTSISDLTTKAEDNTVIDLLKSVAKVINSSSKTATSIGNPPIEQTPVRGRNIFPKNPVEEERTPPSPERIQPSPEGIPITPEGIPITPSSPESDVTKLKKPKGKKSNVPNQRDFAKFGSFALAKRFNEAKKEVKFEDKAKRLSQFLINESIIASSEIPNTLKEWNALGTRLGLIDRYYDSFNGVINAISDNLPPEMRKIYVRGSGESSGSGLYNDQIEQIMKKRINNFVPVVAKDQVDSLLGYVKKGDKFFSAVVNTDPKISGGRHWRCIVMDNRDDFPSAEYFDPLCETMKPEESLLNVMRQIAKKMNPEKYFKYKFSEIRRQSFNKSNCGYHVCKYIEDRYNGVPFSEASGYDDYEKRMKGTGAPDNSTDGEKELKNYEKMIKKKFSEFL
jgi:hypothetical protein